MARSETAASTKLYGVNLDCEANKVVKEYPFYQTRLKTIDWKAIEAAGKPFCDPFFKADVSSILDPTLPPDHEDWRDYEWKRPVDVYGEGNYSLYDKIDPNDIKQGQCGDCYFLSCLSSLAENPQRVKDIFLQDFTNKAGVYAIQLFICGERKTVVVDDRFPWDPTKNNWAFSRTSTGCEIWVLLLEKAWAKVYGNYQRIEGGTCDEALHPLTGCPTKNFIHSDVKDKDKLWSILLLSDQSNFPMCTAVSSQMEDEVSTGDVKKAGLVDGHAYSLIGAKEIKDKAGKTVRLCLVRNPWGKKEWSGDWSDGSSLWDDVTKPQVPNFSVANDGCFWISFEDYETFFYITTICFYKNGYKESQIYDQHSKGQFGMAKMVVSEDTSNPITVSVDQINCRFSENGPNEQEYATVRLFVTKVVESLDENGQNVSEQKWLDGEYQGQMPTVTCAFHKGLSQGTYLIMYAVDFLPCHPLQRIILTAYSENKVQLIRLDASNYGYDRFQQFEQYLKEGQCMELV